MSPRLNPGIAPGATLEFQCIDARTLAMFESGVGDFGNHLPVQLAPAAVGAPIFNNGNRALRSRQAGDIKGVRSRGR